MPPPLTGLHTAGEVSYGAGVAASAARRYQVHKAGVDRPEALVASIARLESG